MKTINNYATYKVNGKEILIVSDNYKGKPEMYYDFDILIASKEIITQFKKQLFPKQLPKKGKTKVLYI